MFFNEVRCASCRSIETVNNSTESEIEYDIVWEITYEKCLEGKV